MDDENLLIHYWHLPKNIFVSLKDDFHKIFCEIIQKKLNSKYKNCFYTVLKCPKWRAQRLFTKFNRFTIQDLEILREFACISKQEVEQKLEAIGNYESGTIIKNPKLLFHMRDLIYIASHLIFDGSYREKYDGYFYSYEKSLTEYHKKRLSIFGEVPINFLEKENQLYFSYTISYISSKMLDMNEFRSTKCFLSDKFKKLCKENKSLCDELIKALIIDDGYIEDKIESELANEKLVKDIQEVVEIYYKINKILSRTRIISFKENPKWKYNLISWKISFSASSFKELYASISPLPIEYKENNLKFLFDRQNRKFNQRKAYETKKLIIVSLLVKPKTISELSKELLVKQTTIRAHLKGQLNFNKSLINLGLVQKVGDRILRRGGFAKAGVYGIKNLEEAKNFTEFIVSP